MLKRKLPNMDDQLSDEEEEISPTVRKSPRTNQSKTAPKSKSSKSVNMSKVLENKIKAKYITYGNTSKDKVGVKTTDTAPTKPLKKASAEKKYSVDYNKDTKLEWYEETGASYRTAQDRKKVSEKQAISKQLMAKTDTLTQMSKGILDLGKDLARQVNDQTDEDPDMMWFKSLLPEFKRIPGGKKNRLKVKIMGLIYDVLEDEV